MLPLFLKVLRRGKMLESEASFVFGQETPFLYTRHLNLPPSFVLPFEAEPQTPYSLDSRSRVSRLRVSQPVSPEPQAPVSKLTNEKGKKDNGRRYWGLWYVEELRVAGPRAEGKRVDPGRQAQILCPSTPKVSPGSRLSAGAAVP